MKYQPATNAREALNKAQERDTQYTYENLTVYAEYARKRGLNALGVNWGGFNSATPHVEYFKIENGVMRIDACGSHLVTHSDLIDMFEQNGFRVSTCEHPQLGRVIDVISWEA